MVATVLCGEMTPLVTGQHFFDNKVGMLKHL